MDIELTNPDVVMMYLEWSNLDREEKKLQELTGVFDDHTKEVVLDALAHEKQLAVKHLTQVANEVQDSKSQE